MHDKMIDLTVDLKLEYNKVLSVLLIDYDNFREWEDVLPFYKNMKKDGREHLGAAISGLNTIIPKTIYQSDFCAFTRTTPNVFVPVGDPEV